MKRTFILLISGLLAIYSQAQTAYDALLFSESTYEGTARSAAMGNAFTALGGDLGSVNLNPAGSAVAGYSQFTITPSLSISASTSQGVMPPNSSGSLPYFQNIMKSRMTRYDTPNLGIALNFDTGRKSGLKNITVGFIVNRTATWNEDTYAKGTNKYTSFMGAMAYEAGLEGLTGAGLGTAKGYDNYPWKYVVGYQSGMISTFGDNDDTFVAASEVVYSNNGKHDISLGGELEQAYERQVIGGKSDYVINWGGNFSDFIYVGANLGFTIIDYSYTDYFREKAVDPANFEIGLDNGETIYFKDMLYSYGYSASGSGVYGKLGVIVTPGGGFRFGAAVQTPTLNNISETWEMEGETTYTDGGYDYSALSPYGTGEYTVVSPMRANFGLAWTFGNFGLVSADYEICDYSTMRYKAKGYDRDYFEEVNDEIKDYFKASHMLRVGAEIKPVPEFAIRAGYNLTTSPEVGVEGLKNQNVSLGLGYSSKNSFFADLAVRKAFISNEYYMPYGDYMYDENGKIFENYYAPELLIQRSLWKVMLTLGWRF